MKEQTQFTFPMMFNSFLNDHHALDKYNKNVENFNGSSAIEILANYPSGCWIIDAFDWYNTEEEHNFWSELNEKWNERIVEELHNTPW